MRITQHPHILGPNPSSAYVSSFTPENNKSSKTWSVNQEMRSCVWIMMSCVQISALHRWESGQTHTLCVRGCDRHRF